MSARGVLMRQPRTLITMGVLAGYLFTVIAALPLHHCDGHRSEPIGWAAHSGCGHCVEACGTRIVQDDRTSSQLDAFDLGHRSDDCIVCHVLAQKSLAILAVAAIGWGEVVSEASYSEPSPPRLSLRFSSPIRAPPWFA